MLKRLTFSTVVSFAALVASAPLITAAHAESKSEDTYVGKRAPIVNLQSEAIAEVQQDTVTIYLAAELGAKTQNEVDEPLRKVVDSVLAEAKQQKEVKVSSNGYRVYPTSDKDGSITGWRGRAELKLESTDIQAAGKLAAQLSNRMPVSGLQFSVSPQARATHEKALLQEAIANFQDRAQDITEKMGFSSYRYKEVNVGGTGSNYHPIPRQAMMASDSVGAVTYKENMALESGTEYINVSVNGSIYLQNGK